MALRTLVVTHVGHLGGPPAEVFTHQSVVEAPAAEVFAWHERPEALGALLPRGPWIRVESRSGGIEDGSRIVLSIGIGPLRLRWVARHFGYVPGCRFCDEQVQGPFRQWHHVHRVEPVGDGQTLYEDRVEFEVPGGAIARRLAHPIVRWGLLRMFSARHRAVRQAITYGRPRPGGR